jgi:hypothetical protein
MLARKRNKVVIEDSPPREESRDRSVSRSRSADTNKKKEMPPRGRKKDQSPEKKAKAKSPERESKGSPRRGGKEKSPPRHKHKKAKGKDVKETESSSDENPNELFAWTTIVEARYPSGTLSNLPAKDRNDLEEAFYRYLETRQKINKEKLHKYEANDSKGLRVVALPRKYVDDFQDWLDEEIKKGLFNKTPVKKTIVTKTNVRFHIVALGLIVFNQHVNKTPRREPKPPTPLDPKLVELLQSPVAREESRSPIARVEATSMVDLFGPPSDDEREDKDALMPDREEHEIDELESPPPLTLWPASPAKKGKSPISPLDLLDEDVDGLMDASMRTILQPPTLLPPLDLSAKTSKTKVAGTSPVKNGEALEWRQWRHVLQHRFSDLDLNTLGKQHTLFTIEFLNRNKIDQRRIMSGRQSAPGIPSNYWDKFTQEFQARFLSAPRPMDLDEGDIEEILEEGTSVNPMQSPVQKVGVPPAAFSKATIPLPGFSNVSNTSSLAGLHSLAPPATSPKKVVTSQIPSFEAVARQTPIVIDDESEKDRTLIRYNMYVYSVL